MDMPPPRCMCIWCCNCCCCCCCCCCCWWWFIICCICGLCPIFDVGFSRPAPELGSPLNFHLSWTVEEEEEEEKGQFGCPFQRVIKGR